MIFSRAYFWVGLYLRDIYHIVCLFTMSNVNGVIVTLNVGTPVMVFNYMSRGYTMTFDDQIEPGLKQLVLILYICDYVSAAKWWYMLLADQQMIQRLIMEINKNLSMSVICLFCFSCIWYILSSCDWVLLLIHRDVLSVIVETAQLFGIQNLLFWEFGEWIHIYAEGHHVAVDGILTGFTRVFLALITILYCIRRFSAFLFHLGYRYDPHLRSRHADKTHVTFGSERNSLVLAEDVYYVETMSELRKFRSDTCGELEELRNKVKQLQTNHKSGFDKLTELRAESNGKIHEFESKVEQLQTNHKSGIEKQNEINQQANEKMNKIHSDRDGKIQELGSDVEQLQTTQKYELEMQNDKVKQKDSEYTKRSTLKSVVDILAILLLYKNSLRIIFQMMKSNTSPKIISLI